MSVEHRFTSQEYDAETGLYYYNARYYNPGLGRFVSADSIVPSPAAPQALNRYSYVLNNPLIYVDPTGHKFKLSKLLNAVVSGVVGGAVYVASGGNPVLVGMAAGAVGGGLAGKNIKSVALGAVTGGILGGVGGIAYTEFGMTGVYTMMAAGAGVAYAQDGVAGLAYYAGGIAGAYIGYSGAEYAMATGGAGGPRSSQNELVNIDSAECVNNFETLFLRI